MTSINNSLSIGENLLIVLSEANNYTIERTLDPPIVNKKFVRFLANYQILVNFNFISNTYQYDGNNPGPLSFAKTALTGNDQIWYPCDNRITQVIASVNPLSNIGSGKSLEIVCEFIDFVPQTLLQDV